MSDIYPIAVPKWGIEMVEGTINCWNYKEGDKLTPGDEVFEMESDKITNVWDSPVAGVLRRIIAEEGDTHPVGALLGVIAAAEVADDAIDAFIAGFSGDAEASSSDSATAAASAPEAPAAKPAAAPNSAATRSSPSVRKLAAELGVDLETVTGTGRRGRITEDDVKAAASADDAGSAGDAGVTVVPLSPTRRTIARRLTEAKQQIPHYYLTVEYELDGLLAHRATLNETGDVKVSVNDLVIWCVSRALMKEPRVNINVIDEEIHQFDSANVSVAIATETGLYPATVCDAQDKSPAEIAAAVAALAERANSGTLTADDISGGSFTVSNLGMYGVSNFTAIINPPMGAILALGKGEQKVVVRDGAPTVATVVSATLSCDHRVIDGAIGATFLQALGEEINALS